MAYYLALKEREILLFATIWMKQEYTMLNEISQVHRGKYNMTSLLCGV
jgi:hypothetical protein